MTSSNFITRGDVVDLIGHDDVSIIDGSWYLPTQERNAHEEYNSMRIPGAVFFDIDKIADPNSDLPHMLPDPNEFAKAASMLGISDSNLIVVYDGPGLFSAPRVWWTLKIMGAPDVRIMEGGFERWKEDGLPVETGNPNSPQPKIFEASFSPENVTAMDEVEAASKIDTTVILDARPEPRFAGKADEPRAGLRKGHIPGSKSLPVTDIIKDGKLIASDELEARFSKLGINQDTPTVTTCGSGVTAAILTLALAETGRLNNKLFDGSWAQWGQENGPPVETNDENT